ARCAPDRCDRRARCSDGYCTKRRRNASSPPRPRPVPSRPRAAMYARTILLRAVYVAVVLFLRPPLPATGAAKIIRAVAALGGARGRAHAACLGLRGNVLSLVHATSPVGPGEARATVQPHSCRGADPPDQCTPEDRTSLSVTSNPR